MIALAGSPTLLFETSLALAAPWAMLLWAVAALAISAPLPRYEVAGIALGLATLARIETLVVVGGIFVSERYFAAIDAAVVVAASVGLTALAVELPAMTRVAGRLAPHARTLLGRLIPATAIVVVAIALTSGWAGLWQTTRATIRTQQDLAVSAQAAVPMLRAAVDAAPGARAWPEPGATPPRVPLLLVPTPLVPMLSLELDLPLTQIGSFDPGGINLAAGIPAPGQIVFLAQVPPGSPSPELAGLLVDQPTRVGEVLVGPLASDPSLGYRIVRIDPMR